MPRLKSELILIIILIPILAYVGWQAYNTYLKPPGMDIEKLEKEAIEEPPKPIVPEIKPAKPKGVLDYTGYIERDPLRPSLPVREKVEKPPIEKPLEEGQKEQTKKEAPKEIVLPTFTVTGIVWGDAPPRAIIDQRIYRIGDTVKGAKILDMTSKGIYMIYEGKEFFVTIKGG